MVFWYTENMSELKEYMNQCEQQFDKFYRTEIDPSKYRDAINLGSLVEIIVKLIIALWVMTFFGSLLGGLLGSGGILIALLLVVCFWIFSGRILYWLVFQLFCRLGGTKDVHRSNEKKHKKRDTTDKMLPYLNLQPLPLCSLKLPKGLCKAKELGLLSSVILSGGIEVQIQRGFQGEENGVKVEILETSYGGFVASCALRRPVEGLTILVGDGLHAKFSGSQGGLKRIQLEWLEFEKAFDLFSTDEREARVIMAPDVMAVVYDMLSYSGEDFCLTFYENQVSCFYWMMSLRNTSTKYEKGEMPRLFKDVSIVGSKEKVTPHKALLKPHFMHLAIMRHFPTLIRHKLVEREYRSI